MATFIINLCCATDASLQNYSCLIINRTWLQLTLPHKRYLVQQFYANATKQMRHVIHSQLHMNS